MLEIGLIIWAWNRGWKGWALLPSGITLFVGFLLIFAGLTGGILILVVADLGTLIFMIAKGRKQEEAVVYIAPVDYNTPAVPQVTPAAELYNQPVKDASRNFTYPPTALAPVSKARLVLPDNTEIAIKDPVKLIGRNDLEKIVPPENLQYISRQHIMIKSDGSRYYVEDQATANSTKVNGINIKGLGKHELMDGDKIDLADAVALTFKVGSAF